MDSRVNEQQKNSNVFLTVTIVALILIIAALLSAATLLNFGKSDKSEKDMSAEDVALQVAKVMNYDSLSEISEENISNYYEIPKNAVTDSAMFVSTGSDSYTEIACFKLKNNSSQDKLVNIINEYIETKKNTYKDVNDKAYSTVSNAKTDIVYPYVFVAITPDSEAAAAAFEELVNSSEYSDEESES